MSIENLNFLSPLGAEFIIKKTPTTNYFVQKASIPEIILPAPEVPNPMVAIPISGDHIQFGSLDITFKIDEDFRNYYEIYNWIIGQGFPENTDQFKQLNSIPRYTGEGLYSDVSLIIYTSSNNPNYEFIFTDAFPVALSKVTFDTTNTNVDYLNCSATFKYTNFTVNKVQN